jgi:putative transposase
MKAVKKILAQYDAWPALSGRDVHRLLSEQLVTLFPTMPTGNSCDPQTVSDVVVKASVDGAAIEGTCQDLTTAPTGVTVRTYLNEALDVTTLTELQSAVNARLRDHLPRQLWRAPVSLAIDLHDEPFYGKDPLLRAYACRSEARAGTTWFYRVATVYVLHKNVPHTLGLLFVFREHTKLDVLLSLLCLVKALHLRLHCLYLDRGFCCQTIVDYLEAHAYPAILACAIRGKTGGTRALCHGRKSYWCTYTFSAGTPEAYTARLAVVRTYETRHGKRSAVWRLYVVVHLKVADPNTICARYRARFGVEGSYRCMRQTHAKTTSRNPAVRFFLLGVAFLILNLWVTLRWHFCQIPRRGGRKVNKPAYELQRHCKFLSRVIERRYDTVATIQAQAVPLRP